MHNGKSRRRECGGPLFSPPSFLRLEFVADEPPSLAGSVRLRLEIIRSWPARASGWPWIAIFVRARRAADVLFLPSHVSAFRSRPADCLDRLVHGNAD